MEQEFAFPPRGVMWTANKNRTLGPFTTISLSSNNTLSIKCSLAANKAREMHTCEKLVLDYSQMLKIENT